MDWAGVMRELATAVERGDMTVEEASEYLAGLHEEHAERHEEHGDDFDEVVERVRDAVRRGDMSREEAEEYLDEVRREYNRMGAWREEASDRFRREIAERSYEENMRELAALERGLDAAVERGARDRAEILSLEIRLIEQALEEEAAESGWVTDALLEMGIKRGYVPYVMGALERGLYAVREIEDEEDRDEVLEELRAFLSDELGLTEDQIEGIGEIGRAILENER